MTSGGVAKKRRKFDPETFLSTIEGDRTIAAFSKKQTIFSQGDSRSSVIWSTARFAQSNAPTS
jgi:hypothetical protein